MLFFLQIHVRLAYYGNDNGGVLKKKGLIFCRNNESLSQTMVVKKTQITTKPKNVYHMFEKMNQTYGKQINSEPV